MTLWAIVPVKPLRRGKSRLAGILDEDERTELNRALLQHSLETLSGVPGVNEVLVVSRDPHALTIARRSYFTGRPRLPTRPTALTCTNSAPALCKKTARRT